jgi:hypothetical protein
MMSRSVCRWMTFLFLSAGAAGHAQQQVGVPVPPLGNGPFVFDTARSSPRVCRTRGA